ncbi:hypothetical protein BS50DRAFT_614100 [Corynespora cassiicola Philippines]|uniref:Ubiquitin-like domain-containing protein n=1 Tax=Corynespora cassiicola Philippines TaxID=1448308 RepID=A0A2T2N4K8_CORCC|nr:hypothetical protein BS50DRAFT_614100 [Corynespora cassiicola Philippines]
MTDPTSSSAAPPKKRSFFKKAAWQSTKTEDEKQPDLFSHSSEYTDIVAEETRRKNEEKRKAEAARRHREEVEEVERKRRKISIEHDELKANGKGPGSASRTRRTASRARSKTPLSPIESGPSDTLTSRYDSLTKSSSSLDSLPQKESNIIELGSDSDDDSLYKAPRAPSDELEEVEDPELAALTARARERAAKRAQTSAAAAKAPSSAKEGVVVELLIDSFIENTKPLLVKIRSGTTMETARDAWTGRQGFSPDVASSVFLTWNMKKLFGSTRIDRLGLHVDENGTVTVDGDSNIYDEENLPKIFLEAWTEDLYKQRQRELAEEATSKKRAVEPSPVIEEEPPIEEKEPEAQRFRIFLKSNRGKEEFKIAVHPHTTFAHIAHAYRLSYKIPDNEPLTLFFDGERLKPLDTVADAEIEDQDTIEVHFK